VEKAAQSLGHDLNLAYSFLYFSLDNLILGGPPHEPIGWAKATAYKT
jgi:hypothetical protein